MLNKLKKIFLALSLSIISIHTNCAIILRIPVEKPYRRHNRAITSPTDLGRFVSNKILDTTDEFQKYHFEHSKQVRKTCHCRNHKEGYNYNCPDCLKIKNNFFNKTRIFALFTSSMLLASVLYTGEKAINKFNYFLNS